jgi:hypothetical protein
MSAIQALQEGREHVIEQSCCIEFMGHLNIYFYLVDVILLIDTDSVLF